MELRVELGHQFAHHGVAIKHFSFHSSDFAEMPPDVVFASMNRVFDLETDFDRLEVECPGFPMARRMREALDQHQAPSMSVGDRITYVSDAGVVVRAVECAPVGWKEIPHGS